jgi:hypothetical protein
MPIGEQADEHLPDHVTLPHDRGLHSLLEVRNRVPCSHMSRSFSCASATDKAWPRGSPSKSQTVPIRNA